ncbi:hypothetical protein BH09PSE2_BH09PSE2_07130 [soil metagenome]
MLLSSLVAALLLQAPPPAVAAQKTGCRFGLVAELPVTFENNRPTVTVEVDGKPLRALLDTGADTSVIFGAAATRLGLKVRELGGVEVYGADGRTKAYVAHIDHLALMGHTGPPFDIAVNLSAGASGEDMLLGRDLLLATDLELDLGHAKVRLVRANACADDEMAYWSDRYSEARMVDGMKDEVRLQVRMNGAYVIAMLDSGAQRSVASDRVAFSAGVALAEPDPHDRITGVAGKLVQMRQGVVKHMTVGDEALNNVPFSFGPMTLQPAFTHGRMEIVAPVEMLLGADFLKAHRVLIAKETGKVYFTYNGGPIFRTTPADAKPLSASTPAESPIAKP